jgi:hypothetical protein
MANLFVVFTPFQFFIAQQIVEQEQLKDCILLMSYIHGNKHFIPIYDLMSLEGMWKKKIEFEDFPQWDGLRTKSINDIKHAYRNYKRICTILKDNNIDSIFLGEQQNTTLRFTDILFTHKGYKIIFFEEGAAHYLPRKYKKPDLKTKIKILFRDIFYYLPLYHIRFAKWRYTPNLPVEQLPMYKRYSIIPHYNESFDVRLYPKSLLSQKLNLYIKKSIRDDDKKRVLFLTDPLNELISDQYIHIYYEIIDKCFHQIDKTTTVYIKYHPRDKVNSKRRIEKLAHDAGLDFLILSKEINIPVEYYLQNFVFDKVYVFNASTFFYNGYLFPKTVFVKLLPIVYERLILEKSPKRIINIIKKFIDSMDECCL